MSTSVAQERAARRPALAVPSPDPDPVGGRRRERIGLALLLAATAALYLVGIGGSGWGNTYYSAAAQAGAESWHAFFYGASDAPASITIDKPPASIWLMALSVRLLGLHPVAVALPQAVLGVLAVALVHATVRRVTGPSAALLAGAVAATTPIAALVFRYNNPDALLTALIALAGYATVRVLEQDRLRWILLAGAAIGLAFLTKQLQALLPVPGLALGVLVAGQGGLGRRMRSLLLAGGGMLVSAAWWVAIVELVPASSRPYIGGSQTNSFLELTLGYNGLGRILGGDGNGAGRTSDAMRLLSGASGLGVGWLLPGCLILGIGALVMGRRAPRTDRARALLLASPAGLLLTVLALSMMSGIYHSYYCAVLVPALATTIGISVHVLTRHLERPGARAALAVAILVTTAWSLQQLAHGPAYALLALPLVAVTGLAATLLLGLRRPRPLLRRSIAVLAILAALTGPALFSISTAAAPHAGSGPVVASPSQEKTMADPQVVDLLLQTSGDGTPSASGASRATRWAAATEGSRPAAVYQLATDLPVMPIGGYKHTDPSPTLDQFRTLVEQGRVHWYIGSEGEIGHWVASHYPAQRLGRTVVYDLSAPPTAAG